MSSHNSKSIYDGASQLFRDKQNELRFQDTVARLHHILGGFESIVRVTRNDRIEGREGLSANVRYEFKFEKVETRGEFSYIKEPNQDWRLLGFDVRVPESLAESFEKVSVAPTRLSAPEAVLQETKNIIELLKENKSNEVYEAASNIFRAGTTSEKFAIAIKAQERTPVSYTHLTLPTICSV